MSSSTSSFISLFLKLRIDRWSTDDLVTAWTAGRAVEDYSLDVNAYLDLGCGKQVHDVVTVAG